MESTDPGALPRRIGRQIRTLRTTAGVSPAELAGRARTSERLLLQIERGRWSPSSHLLERIANALGVGLWRFFLDRPARAAFCRVRAGQGLVLQCASVAPGPRCELLGHALTGILHVESQLVHLAEHPEPTPCARHPGLKFIHLIEGQVRYRHGRQVFAVKAGDSLLFDASVSHGIQEVVQLPTTYLALVSSLRD